MAKVDKMIRMVYRYIGRVEPALSSGEEWDLMGDDKDQAYYWTEAWQQGEREADQDIAAGRVSGPFDNAEDLIDSLNTEA